MTTPPQTKMSLSEEYKSWYQHIAEEMDVYNESWKDVVSTTLTDEALHKKFDSGYGCSQGEPFTVWTTNRVYFPVVYKGAEWCGSVSRTPDGIATEHQGAS
jgi:hypothetical protein